MPATMTLDDATKEIERLKAQVVALEQLLDTHEQIVADQSDRLHETIQERERQTESLRHRLAFENLLAQISAEFINVPLAEIDQGFNRALRMIGEFVQADRSYLFQVRNHGTTMDNTHEWCAPGISPQIERLQQLPTAAFPWVMERYRRHEAVHIPRVMDLPPEAAAERQEFQAEGIQSMLCVPIVLRNELLGFVGFDSVRAERTWSEDTITLLRLVGTIFANALDRASAENTLRKNEEHFRALIEHSLDIITILAPDGTVRYQSPSLQRVLGWHPSDRVGRSAFELLHPEDGPHAREVLRNVLGNPGVTHSMECRFRHQDGSWRAIESFGTMTQDPKGNPCIVINSRDVTERRQTEEALRRSQARFAAFMQHLPAVAFMKDAEGRHTYVNQRFEDLLNLTHDDWYMKTAEELFPPELAAMLVEHDRIVLTQNAPLHRIEKTVRDGEVRHWLVSKFPVRLDDRASPLLGGVAIDVTDRIQAEEALRDHLSYVQALNAVAQTIAQEDDCTGMLQRMVDIVGKTLNVDRCLIYDVDLAQDLAIGLCEWLNPESPGVTPTVATYPLELFRDGARYLYETHRPLVSHDDDMTPHFLRDGSGEILHRQMSIKSLLWYPFAFRPTGDQRPAGFHVLVLNQVTQRRMWTGEELAFVGRAAAHVTLGLQKLEHLAELQKREQTLARERQLFIGGPVVVFRWIACEGWPVEYASPNAVGLFGYTSEDFTSGRVSYSTVVYPNDLKRVAGEVAAQSAEGVVRFGQHYRIVRSDGAVRWLDDYTVVVRDAEGRITHYEGYVLDATERKRAEQLLEAEKRILEAIARGNPLADVLDLLARQVETLTEKMLCSILLMDDDGLHLRHGAAPSLPDSYNQLVDGLAIGPSVGSCGTAAHRKERVIVSDIATDPLWKDFREVARRYGLGACWSTPIVSASGALLGTFALYYREPSEPMPDDLRMIDRMTHLTQIAIERHRSESALAQLARRLELILTSAGEGIFGLDLDGRVTFANPAMAKMLGWRVEDMIGQPGHARWHNTRADGTPSPVEECPIYAAFKDGLTHLHTNEVFWRKDGTPLPVEYVSAPLLDKGHIIGSVVVCRDITDRKQAEEELRRTYAFLQSVVENIPHMILVKEAKELRFISANKASEEFLGIPRTDMIGKTVYDLFPEAQADALFADDLDVLSAGGAKTLPDQVIETKNRGPRVFHTRKIAIPGPDQRPAYILSISEDITERKQAAEALVQRETDLRKALEERERIGQDLHDGILQSLYAVGLGLEACKPLLGQQRKKAAMALDHAIRQLNSLMREIRAFITGLESELRQTDDLPGILQNMVAALAQPYATKFHVSVDPAVGHAVTKEQALHLLNIVKEAVSNSLRHGRAKRATVSLRLLKRCVRLTIRDNGVGFNATKMGRTGHGLANMASRAHKVGGTLSVSSRPNKGTCVMLDLPKENSYARS